MKFFTYIRPQQAALGKKVEEASLLTAQNTDLEAKLTTSQEDCKRCSSGLKRVF